MTADYSINLVAVIEQRCRSRRTVFGLDMEPRYVPDAHNTRQLPTKNSVRISRVDTVGIALGRISRLTRLLCLADRVWLQNLLIARVSR